MSPLDDEDPWPDEPDEFDPHSLGPEIPTVEAPDPGRLPRPVLRVFVATVVMANVALLGLAVGVMLVVFRGDWTAGAAAIAVGLVAAAGVARYTWLFVNEEIGVPDDADTPTESAAEAEDTAGGPEADP